MNIPVIPNNHIIRDSDPSRDLTPKKKIDNPLSKDTATFGEESLAVSHLLIELRQIRDTHNPDLNAWKLLVDAGLYDPGSDKIAKAILYGEPGNS